MKKSVHRGKRAMDVSGPHLHLDVYLDWSAVGSPQNQQSLDHPWADDGLEMSSLAADTQAGRTPANPRIKIRQVVVTSADYNSFPFQCNLKLLCVQTVPHSMTNASIFINIFVATQRIEHLTELIPILDGMIHQTIGCTGKYQERPR